MKVASLFAGIGGICLGFKQAGADIVWANEIDKDACITYRHNFGDDYLIEGDIHNIDATEIPEIDILNGGFPCQAFSIAGYRKGFEDTRGTLFFEIARLLEKEGYTTVSGNKHWSPSTIKSILMNEKYKGDALLQKYYTADFLARRPVINNGEIPQYYVKKNHEAIVDPKIFDLVQKEIKYRSGNWEMNMGKHIFSGRIKCGSCGANFGPKVWHSNQRYRKQIWQCNDKYIDRYNKCPTPHCTEELIKELFVKALNKLIQNKEILIKNFEEIKDEIFNPSQEKEQLNLAIEKRTNLITMLNQLTEENARVKLDQQIYQERYEEISIQYAETSKQITVLDETIKSKQYRKTKSELFLKELNKQKDIVTDFSDSFWISFVDYVTVYNKDDIRFTFKNGMEV